MNIIDKMLQFPDGNEVLLKSRKRIYHFGDVAKVAIP